MNWIFSKQTIKPQKNDNNVQKKTKNSFIPPLFFLDCIYLSFFFYSPLKVCHHARCSFSVGTCRVSVDSVRGGSSHAGATEENGERGGFKNP